MIASEINRGIAELLPHTSYHLVISEPEKEAVFRLRYAAYLREEAVAPNAESKLQDAFDDRPNAFNIAVKVRGQLIGAMRICVWSRHFGFDTTPGLDAFPHELMPYLREETILIDPNRFVVDASITRNQASFAFLLMRISFMACIKFKATFAIATARREHCGFYMRSFGHKRITEPRLYPGLTKPLALLVNDFGVNHQPSVARYPSFRPLGDDLEHLFDALVAESDHAPSSSTLFLSNLEVGTQS